MKLDNVLVGTDFSDASIAAARWTAQHLVPDGEVVLVHVVDVPQAPAFLRLLLPAAEAAADDLHAAAEQRMQELVPTLGPARVTAVIRSGAAPQTIAALAREHGADMVVVGEHGQRRGVRGLIGTTAERLLALSPVPVLIARDLPAGPPRSLLAPLDASPMDARVLDWGRTLCERYDGQLTACHAVDLMDLYSRVRTLSAAGRLKQLEQEFRQGAQDWIIERLKEAGLPSDAAAAEVRIGDARYAIPGMAELSGADLIIMGRAGAGAVTRVIVGSVTSAVLSSTSYPVLVVVGDTT
jgi:universal stress protein E